MCKVGIPKAGFSKERREFLPYGAPVPWPGTEVSLSHRDDVASVQYSCWIQPATRPPLSWDTMPIPVGETKKELYHASVESCSIAEWAITTNEIERRNRSQ